MALFFTYVLPLLLPTAVYMLWRLVSAPRPAGGANSKADNGTAAALASRDDLWRNAPWLWLAIAGAVLLAIVLLVGVFVHGSPPQAQYVPPRIEDGHIVPGELRPDDSTAGRSRGSHTESTGGPPSGAR